MDEEATLEGLESFGRAIYEFRWEYKHLTQEQVYAGGRGPAKRVQQRIENGQQAPRPDTCAKYDAVLGLEPGSTWNTLQTGAPLVEKKQDAPTYSKVEVGQLMELARLLERLGVTRAPVARSFDSHDDRGYTVPIDLVPGLIDVLKSALPHDETARDDRRHV